MPIVEIRALPQKPSADVPYVLERVCTELAAAVGIPEKQIWATWEVIEERHYVEGRNDMPDQPPTTHPPLVRILAYQGRSEDTIRTMLETVARSVTDALGLEEGNAFVVYEELKAGRVYSAGDVLD
jgi:phenylpyruvate tautomerase PptA (4-oxalocrotonate tautomerase family)